MQRRLSRLWRIGFFLVGMAVLMRGVSGISARAGVMGGQQSTSNPQQPTAGGPIFSASPPNANDPSRDRMQERQVAAVEDARHRRMIVDTDKLLELATELKDDVDKSTKNEMSVASIKKAAEIEKLAHDVKERMKGQ